MGFLLLGLTLAAGYLIGGVPFGWLAARWRGVDILRHGSGNIGATNVGRVLGRRFGALVFALDFTKGAVPVLAASLLPESEYGLPHDSLRVVAGAAAFLGHLFPIYLRFRGGKGVATGVGVVAVLTPLLAVLVLAAWAVTLAAFRYVSLASLGAALLLSVLRLTFTPLPWSLDTKSDNLVVTAFCVFGTVLVFVRHAANIGRLLRGTESRIKDSPAMLLFSKTVHVLALSLWFGTVVFFAVAASVQVQTLDEISKRGPDHPNLPPRPWWFPVPADYKPAEAPRDNVPEALREKLPEEQGSRAFGAVVGPVFPWYFGVQAGCGVVTLLTAVGWWMSRRGSRVHAVRAVLLIVALAGVGLGWWMRGVVEGLRGPRDEATMPLLKGNPTEDEVNRAATARGAFVAWHSYSLFTSFGVILLVGAATALAAQMPAPTPLTEEEKKIG